MKSYPERLADALRSALPDDVNVEVLAALPEPDGADDGTTGETVAVVETPRRPQ